VNGTQIQPIISPNDNNCSDYVTISALTSSFVMLGGGDDTLTADTNTLSPRVCGDYCTCMLSNQSITLFHIAF
jgi:hypothetical protein